MQLHIEINRWLSSSQDFEQGIALFEKACNDEFFLNLFKKYENPYTRGKLEEKLQEWADTISTQNKASQAIEDSESQDTGLDKIVKSAIEPIVGNNMPEVILNFQQEKGILFKEILQHRRKIKETLDLKTKGYIVLRDALRMMEQLTKTGKSLPFSITYITWNDSTHRGGEIISWSKAVVANLNLTGSRIQPTRRARPLTQVKGKNPNHWKNSTRNINPEGSLEVRKLHIWLIFEFNGMEVLLSEPG